MKNLNFQPVSGRNVFAANKPVVKIKTLLKTVLVLLTVFNSTSSFAGFPNQLKAGNIHVLTDTIYVQAMGSNQVLESDGVTYADFEINCYGNGIDPVDGSGLTINWAVLTPGNGVWTTGSTYCPYGSGDKLTLHVPYYDAAWGGYFQYVILPGDGYLPSPF